MAAYYSEWDPFAAQWLRELIKAGHIADGVVDDRSILDVSADDLRGYDQCHFFAGIGVWSYSLRRAGWSDDRPVWTGSVPCQPLSVAGLGKGHADERHLWPAFHSLIAERRPPVVLGEQVAGKDGREWFSAVRADLEADGYACGSADLCAAGVGAPHIRQRLYWLAHAAGGGREPRPGVNGVQAGEVRNDAIPEPRADGSAVGLAHADQQQWNGSGHAGAGRRREPADDRSAVWLADADNPRLEGRRQPGRQRAGQRPAGAGGVAGGLADAAGAEQRRRAQPGNGDGELGAPGAGDGEAGGLREPVGLVHAALVHSGRDADAGGMGGSPRAQHREAWAGSGQADRVTGATGGLADADGRQRGGVAELRGPVGDGQDAGWPQGGGQPESHDNDGGLADAINDGQRQHRDGVGGTPRAGEGEPEQRQRLWPDPADGGATGRSSAHHGFWSDADWLYCRDGKWRPVEPGTFPLAHGAAARVGRLRGYGNAIVAPLAQTFIESVMDLTSAAEDPHPSKPQPNSAAGQ